MTLTGKANEDFEKYTFGIHIEDIYLLRLDIFKERKLCIQQACIIDWLDSVNIIIESGIYPQPENNILFSFTIYGNKSYETDEMYNTRHEATTEAIKQANIIYNERN